MPLNLTQMQIPKKCYSLIKSILKSGQIFRRRKILFQIGKVLKTKRTNLISILKKNKPKNKKNTKKTPNKKVKKKIKKKSNKKVATKVVSEKKIKTKVKEEKKE